MSKFSLTVPQIKALISEAALNGQSVKFWPDGSVDIKLDHNASAKAFVGSNYQTLEDLDD
jgi:hypothetical protein